MTPFFYWTHDHTSKNTKKHKILELQRSINSYCITGEETGLKVVKWPTQGHTPELGSRPGFLSLVQGPSWCPCFPSTPQWPWSLPFPDVTASDSEGLCSWEQGHQWSVHANPTVQRAGQGRAFATVTLSRFPALITHFSLPRAPRLPSYTPPLPRCRGSDMDIRVKLPERHLQKPKAKDT